MKPDMHPDMPRAVEAEAALLGAVLLDARAWPEVSDVVRAEDFYVPAHGAIYRAIETLVAAGQPVEPLTVESQLRRDGRLTLAGGLVAIGELQSAPALWFTARTYARLVRDAALCREAIIGARGVATAAYKQADDPAGLAARLSALAAGIVARAGQPSTAVGEVARAVVTAAADAHEGKRLALAPNVHAVVDSFLPRLHAGEMLVIGGRPASGKSNLAADLAWGYARAGHPGLVLTLEDDAETWTRREMAKLGKLDAEEVRSGRLDVAGWTALHATVDPITTLPLAIEDVRGQRACDLVGRLVHHAARRRIRFAVVDYAQLVRASQRSASPEEAMASVVRDLKAAAGTAHVALVLCSQLRRADAVAPVEPRPVLADLRGSGMLEAQADAVILLWRHKRSDYAACRLILEKHKHGPAGELALSWLPHRRLYQVAPSAVKASTGSEEDWRE